MECIQTVINTLSDWTGLKAIPSLCDLTPEKHDVVLDVPSYSQTDDYSCGAIGAWSIVETFSPRANFWRFYQAVQPVPGEGVGPGPLIWALRKFKVGARMRTKMGWADIKKTIDNGFPMLIGTGMDSPEGDHWNVLYGYGLHPRRVYLGNQIGVLCNQCRVDWDEFLESWWNPVGKAVVCWGR